MSGRGEHPQAQQTLLNGKLIQRLVRRGLIGRSGRRKTENALNHTERLVLGGVWIDE